MTLTCIYIYIFGKFLHTLKGPYVNLKQILCFTHMRQEIRQTYLLQATIQNYLNRVLSATVVLFTTNYQVKSKVFSQ
jgi:hypothetical protein